MDSFRKALGYLAFALLALILVPAPHGLYYPSGFIALMFSAGLYAHEPGRGTVAEFVGAPITYLARPLHSVGVMTMRSGCLPFSRVRLAIQGFQFNDVVSVRSLRTCLDRCPYPIHHTHHPHHMAHFHHILAALRHHLLHSLVHSLPLGAVWSRAPNINLSSHICPGRTPGLTNLRNGQRTRRLSGH